MDIEINDLDMILNYLETTSLEPHDDYTSEFTYKDQKILYKYIKELQQENEQLKEELEWAIGIVEHNRIISEKNKEIHQLKDNWDKLRKWIVYNKHNENTEQHYLVVDYGTLLGKMQEIEGDGK